MKKSNGMIFSLLQRIQYELAVFFLLMLRGFPFADLSGLSGWQGVSYAVSYKDGFSSRFLIGSLLSLFTGGTVTSAGAARFSAAATVFDCIITAVLLGELVHIAQKRGQLLCAAVPAAIYLALPTNISCYFIAGEYAGKLEVYLLPLMLLAAFLLTRTRPSAAQFIALTVISVIALLIYQNYVFLCFPLVLALLINNLYEYGWNRTNIIGSLAVCIVTGGLFLYLQLFARVNYPDAAAFTSALQARTDIEIVPDAVFYEYFCPFGQFYGDLMWGRNLYQLGLMLFDVILLSPAVIFYFYVWIKAILSSFDRSERTKLILMQLCSLACVPTFVITCDWARWAVWFFMFQLSLLLVLWYKGCRPIVEALTAASDCVRKYPAVSAAVLVYFFSLSLNSVSEMFWISTKLREIFFNN